MPELPEVESVRRSLDPVLRDARIVDVLLRRPDLRSPFPRRFRARLIAQTVLAVMRRAKYLLVTLSSGDTLVMHLGMSGSFRVDQSVSGANPTGRARRSDFDRHDHVVFFTSSGAIITFNDPRRFGFMDLLTATQLARHPVLEPARARAAVAGVRCRRSGESLQREEDAAEGRVARSARGRRPGQHLRERSPAPGGSVSAAQGFLACHAERRAAPEASRLTAAIKRVLTRAIERTSDTRYRSSRFRVYDREGLPCLRAGCGGTIKRRTQAGRSTFYCPVCQR